MNKLNRKIVRGRLLYIVYCSLLLVLAYFTNRFYQMFIFITLFNFIHSCFRLRFHIDTIITNPVKAVRYCKIITIIVELVYLATCDRLDLTLYSNLLLIFVICLINCLLEYYFEHLITNKSLDRMLRDKDTLLDMSKQAKLTEEAIKRLILKYVECKSYEEIAYIDCVDVKTIETSICRSRAKLKKIEY